MTRQWSKLKAGLRERWSPTVRDRLDVHIAMYRVLREEFGRVWFTWDGEEVYSFDDAKTHLRTYRLRDELVALGEDYDAASDKSMAAARAEGQDHVGGFGESAERFLSLKIGEAVRSDDPIVRGLSMIDRRAGRPTVTWEALQREIHPFVRRLRDLRCNAEGWSPTQVTLRDAE
jgi:hypothetical protein